MTRFSKVASIISAFVSFGSSLLALLYANHGDYAQATYLMVFAGILVLWNIAIVLADIERKMR